MNDKQLYEITSSDGNNLAITMLPDHCVYQGHFPGNPITPGVMTLKMIRECVESMENRSLRYAAIKNCRFAAVIRPNDKLRLTTELRHDNGSVFVKAALTGAGDPDDIRLQLDAELQ